MHAVPQTNRIKGMAANVLELWGILRPVATTIRSTVATQGSRVTGPQAVHQSKTCLGLVIAAFALFVLPCAVLAQQGGDLSQQMQLFNSLPSDQQQAILQRLGIGGGTGSSLGGLGSGLSSAGGLGGYNSSQAALIQQQLLQQQRRQQGQDDSQQQFGPPVFKPGDTVLVDISLEGENQNPGNAANNALSGQNPSQNGRTGNAQDNASTGNQLTPQQLLLLGQQTNQQQSINNQRLQERPQQPIEELEANEKQRLMDLVDLVRAHNPYVLDSNGELQLPGIPSIALAGLTEDLATRRASAEPAFAKLQIDLTLLPLKKSGRAALKPFGYDLFDNSLLNNQVMLNVPVPADYVIGPGDSFEVQLFGSQNQTIKLTVSRDGRISFPQLGPIAVGGQRYSEVKSDIEARVAREMIGVRANVSMGDTRTISVFVLGEAKYAGSYTVTGLATVTTALFAAGGVKAVGSLRNIQLKRQGAVVRTVDLYDLLMRGDSANDAKLLPGDVVFIPSVGSTVSIDGEVQRPAIYELNGPASIAELISMGGGLTPVADRDTAALLRVDERQRRVVLNVNPTAPVTASPALRNGDALHVLRLRPQLDSGITLQGFVYRPQYLAWREGLRLSDVVSSIDELKPNADQNYLLIRRELPPDRRITVLSADLATALRAPGSTADTLLAPRDTVTVFDLQSSRDYVIQPLMDELRVQSNLTQPVQIVHVDGRVKVPGDYPLETGMRVSDLIRAGGSLDSAAYGTHAELSRYTVDRGEQRRTEVLSIDLAAIRSGEPNANIALQPFDRLSIKQISGWTEQDQVTLKGEVRFPGTYTIQQGETLRSVIERAGGLTALAFPAGSVFTRTELKEREQQQLDRFAERMRMAIAEEALEGARGNNAGSTQALTIGQSLLDQIKSAKAVGRLVINLQASLRARPGSSNDVILRNGDELIVPKQRQEVMVIGEVQSASSHLFQRSMSRNDYIDQSGGFTRQADRSDIYVVRADGSVDAGHRGWFSSSEGTEIRPGDAIVVPLDTERLPGLVLWQSISTILYNIAIATATARTL
jgi:polysaccharide biosynthesis/export protein